MKAFILGLLCLSLVGCASNPDKYAVATASLISVRDITVATAQTGDLLCREGKVEPKKCEGFRDAYEKAKLSYNVAVILLETAIKTKDDEGWAKFEKAKVELLVNSGEMQKLAQEFGGVK